MAVDIAEVARVALELPPNERAALAHTLLESLDDDVEVDEQGVEAAWAAEIERRVDDVLSGAVETVPREAVRAHIAEDRAARRH